MSVKVTWEERGLYRRYAGVVTHAELIRAVEAMHADSRSGALQYSSDDFSEMDIAGLPDADLESFVTYLIGARTLHRHGCVAFVTTNFKITEVVSHFVLMVKGAYPVGVFSTLPEAQDWVSRITATV